MEEEIEYLEERNLDMAKLDLLLSRKRHREAAFLHFEEGRYLAAFPLFLEDGKVDRTSMLKAKDCVMQGLWQTLGFGANVTDKSVETMAYNHLECLHRLVPGTLSENELNEVNIRFPYLCLSMISFFTFRLKCSERYCDSTLIGSLNFQAHSDARKT